MRLGLDCRATLSDDLLAFGRQLACEDVVTGARAILSTRSQEGPPHLLEQELNAMRERVEAVGMRHHAIENLPFPWYGDIFFGGAQQDEQIEH